MLLVHVCVCLHDHVCLVKPEPRAEDEDEDRAEDGADIPALSHTADKAAGPGADCRLSSYRDERRNLGR